MGVHIHHGTMDEGVTPICNSCGISLCWDIHESDYNENKGFWDAWICEECNGGVKFNKAHYENEVRRTN